MHLTRIQPLPHALTEPPRILKPGRNCERIATAGRAAALIDGAAYFARLESALKQAKRSILIIGWDFDGSIRLRPDLGPDAPALGPLLRSLVETQFDLEVRILVWSVAVVHAPGAPAPLLFGAEWQNHPRIRVKLDSTHPIYAAHHQKIVCVDNRLAFVGGMDLTLSRWDTCRHAVDDALRIDPDGKPYGPVHDVQLVVDGEAAEAVCAIGRRRWETGSGERLDDSPCDDGPWPEDLEPDFIDVPVAIARTAPGWGGEPALAHAAALTADALKAARRSIYIEAQYMAAPFVGKILAAALARDDGPEIVILMTHASRGLVEEFVMGANRDRLIRRLRRADRFGRMRVYYPVVPSGPDEAVQVLVHSKVIVVDDVFIRIGSSNLNNRSVGLDTECDLAIEAPDEATRATIAELRDRLLAEHLDADPEAFSDAVASTGSLIEAVEAFNTRPRGLRAFDGVSAKGPLRPVFGTGLLDPRRPFEPLWFLRRRRRKK